LLFFAFFCQQTVGSGRERQSHALVVDVDDAAPRRHQGESGVVERWPQALFLHVGHEVGTAKLEGGAERACVDEGLHMLLPEVAQVAVAVAMTTRAVPLPVDVGLDSSAHASMRIHRLLNVLHACVHCLVCEQSRKEEDERAKKKKKVRRMMVGSGGLDRGSGCGGRTVVWAGHGRCVSRALLHRRGRVAFVAPLDRSPSPLVNEVGSGGRNF
jgi:hypothetical protein